MQEQASPGQQKAFPGLVTHPIQRQCDPDIRPFWMQTHTYRAAQTMNVCVATQRPSVSV